MSILLVRPPINELAHYGVLGMKWGRRKKPESVQLQKARAQVKEADENLKKELTRMNKETKYGLLIPSNATLKRVSDADRERRYAKTDLNSVKILERLNGKEKSKYQLKMEAKYKEKGLTDDEAAVAAYQNIRTKKILLAVGATALVVGGSYAAYKYRDARVDKIIKSGSLLQNISKNGTAGVRDAFYASNNVLDNVKYKGLYGGEILQRGNNVAFKKDIKVLSDIKQASYKNAHQALSDLVKSDPEFSNELKSYITTDKSRLGFKYYPKIANAEKSLAKGLIDKNVYEVFNASLVDHDPQMQKLTDRYFKELSRRGYNAIKDINDSKYSGYEAINPIIAFGSKGKVDVVDVKALTTDEINKAEKIAYVNILGTDLIKKGAGITAGILGYKTASSSINRELDINIAKKYRAEHPNSKLTNTEIIRMLERSK